MKRNQLSRISVTEPVAPHGWRAQTVTSPLTEEDNFGPFISLSVIRPGSTVVDESDSSKTLEIESFLPGFFDLIHKH